MLKVFSQYFPFQVFSLFVTEHLLLWGSLLLAVGIRSYQDPLLATEFVYAATYGIEAFVIIILGQLCFYYNSLYDLSTVCRRSEFWIRFIQALGGWCVLLALGFTLYPDLFPGHGILVIAVL